MFNFVRALYAALYTARVSRNLGAGQELSDVTRFPGFIPLVRRARINGLNASQCAEMLRSIVGGVDQESLNASSRDIAINAALESMEGNKPMWAGRT
jgi:hypothetical protein